MYFVPDKGATFSSLHVSGGALRSLLRSTELHVDLSGVSSVCPDRSSLPKSYLDNTLYRDLLEQTTVDSCFPLGAVFLLVDITKVGMALDASRLAVAVRHMAGLTAVPSRSRLKLSFLKLDLFYEVLDKQAIAY